MSSEVYDVAVVGSGVIGLFVAYELSKYDVKVIVIDKELEPGFGVSKGHASVIHVIQLPFGSVKSILAIYGNKLYDRVARELNVKLWRVPLLLVAASVKELLVAPIVYLILKLYYGVRGFKVSIVNGRSLREIEPNVVGFAAVKVEGYGVIDSFDLIYKLYRACRDRGVRFMFNAVIEDVAVNEDAIVVRTSRGVVKSRFLVNSAGLYSDMVASMAGGASDTIVPKRGAMLVFDKLQVKSIVAPLQFTLSGETKGGGIIPTTWGHTIWGPTLSKEGSREDVGVYTRDIRALYNRFSRLVMVKGNLIKAYAGVRPSSSKGDFIISYSPRTMRVVNLIGIESPGLTAAPAIALIVLWMLKRAGLKLRLRVTTTRRELAISTRDKLVLDPSKVQGYAGIIICPCMKVSLADIMEAVRSGSTTLDGIMFRTKLGMGSCQGQHCIGRAIVEVLRLTGVDPEKFVKNRDGSWLVLRS